MCSSDLPVLEESPQILIAPPPPSLPSAPLDLPSLPVDSGNDELQSLDMDYAAGMPDSIDSGSLSTPSPAPTLLSSPLMSESGSLPVYGSIGTCPSPTAQAFVYPASDGKDFALSSTMENATLSLDLAVSLLDSLTSSSFDSLLKVASVPLLTCSSFQFPGQEREYFSEASTLAALNAPVDPLPQYDLRDDFASDCLLLSVFRRVFDPEIGRAHV